jgi:hypothetical protein
MGRPKGSKNKIERKTEEVHIKTFKSRGITLADKIEEHLELTDVLKITKKSLFKLEGVAEALKPFHPRLGSYIEGNINEIRRAIYAHEKPDTTDDWHNLGSRSKPGWEGVDREVEEAFENSINDRKIMDELEGIE